MKKLMAAALIVIGLVWSTPARASLFTYDFSVVMLDRYLAEPRFGNVSLAVSFPQDTARNYPYGFGNFDFFTSFAVNGYRTGGIWSLSQVSLLDYRFQIGDPGGNLYFDLLYDSVQAANAPFREPDRLMVNFGYELPGLRDWCDTAITPPCPIGTGGTHTFDQGEFSFARDHVDVPEPASMLLAGAGLVGMAIVIRRRTKP